MIYTEKAKKSAQELRRNGHSFGEISKILGIAKSTASLWTRNVTLDNKAVTRINNNSIWGRAKGTTTLKKKRDHLIEICHLEAEKDIKNAKINKQSIRIFCSLLYWGEGSKNDSCLRFTNSDPKMISTFLSFLRNGFAMLDEQKFRCVLQIHEYHNTDNEIRYWSKITQIPASQFTKSFSKPHTKKTTRNNYHGTIGIKYYDTKLVHKIKAIYNTLSDLQI